MIKITDLNVVLTDNTGSEVQGTGEMIVGTSPITKEVRDEELNLQNTPNFVISAIIPNADVDVTENYNVSFDANEKHYSTVMTVMTKTNLRTGVKVNLQSTGAEITEEDIVHEPVYIVLAFDKYNRQIPLNNIPAYQSGRNAVFDGAYLMCCEGNSGEFVINPKLMYGDMASPWITENQDANGRSLLMDNLGAFALNWSSFEDNNEQTITFKAVISETGSIDEGEVLTTFDITFVGHPESHTLEFDNDNYATSYDIYTQEKSQARFNVLYDGTSIHLEYSMFSDLNFNKFEPIQTSGGIFKAKDDMSDVSVGQYVDDVTVVYEGMTTSCTVTLTVTNSDPDHVPNKRITCTTSRREFVIYDSDPNVSTETIEYTDTFDKTVPDATPDDPMPWVKTQLKYYVDGIEQNVILDSDGHEPWDDNGNLRLGAEPSETYTEYTVTGGLGYWDEDNFIEIAPSDTVYKYSKVDPDYEWDTDGELEITALAVQNDSDFSDDGIVLKDYVQMPSTPDTMYINGNYDFHIESVGIMYDNQNNLFECNSNSEVAFVFKDFGDHSQESNYKAHHIKQINFAGINTAAANAIFSAFQDINGNTVSWVNEEIPDTGRNTLTGNIPSVDTIKMNLTPIIQQVGTITIENILISGNIGGAGAGEK